MVKKVTLFILLMAAYGAASAGPVPFGRALQVATNFAQQKGLLIDSKGGWADISSKTSFEEFYVLSGPGGKGFVLVSKDDCVEPILGYSLDGTFQTEDMPDHVLAWLNDYDNEIRFNRENSISASPQVQARWEALEEGGAKASADLASHVDPLLTTQWNQWSGNYTRYVTYNRYCPRHGSYHAVTGCVATAMAQIMKYWNWPRNGRGSTAYTYNSGASSNYDGQSYSNTLSSNFADTIFDWDNMPDQLSYTGASTDAQINAVASLMYNVGIAVHMEYGSGGSGASTAVPSSYVYNDGSTTEEQYSPVDVALRKYFHYKYTTNAVYYEDFTNSEWISMLKMELNAGRPVLYAGSGVGGGHAFVFDCYDPYDHFHVNWGWGGNNDGYYAVGSLNPGSGGAGASSSNQYNQSNRAIIGIEPAAIIEPEDGVTTITAVPDNTAHGSVTGSGTYSNYTSVATLTATPSLGYRFKQWSDGNRDNPRYIKATGGNQAYTALFVAPVGSSSAYKLHTDEWSSLSMWASFSSSSIPEWGIKLPYAMLADAESIDRVIFAMWSYTEEPAQYEVKVYRGWPGVPYESDYPAVYSETITCPARTIKIDSVLISVPIPIDHTNRSDMYVTLSSTNGLRCYFNVPCPSEAHWERHSPYSNNPWFTSTSAPYLIKVHCQMSNLPTPASLIVDNISENGARIAWSSPASTSLTPTSYVVAYGEGLMPDAMPQVVTTNLNQTLSGLRNNTLYHVFVKARYRNNAASSEWVHTSFRTHTANLQNPVAVTVVANNDEWGSVSGTGVYERGANVEISAVAMPGYSFEGWQDGNTDVIRTITPTSDVTYTATFARNGYTFEAVSNSTYGTVTVEGQQSWTNGGVTYYPYLSTVRLTAEPTQSFVQWDDGNTSNPRYCTVTGNTVIQAQFQSSGSKVSQPNGQRRLDVSVVEAAPVAVYDMLGRCVFRAEAVPGSPTNINLPSAGVYLVRIGSSYAEKIVVR